MTGKLFTSIMIISDCTIIVLFLFGIANVIPAIFCFVGLTFYSLDFWVKYKVKKSHNDAEHG